VYLCAIDLADAFPLRASAIGGVKRKRSSKSIPLAKKVKIDPSLPPLLQKPPKIVQCAFYGIERLRHCMDITHSMSILLSGEELSPPAHFFYTDDQQQMKI